MSLIKPLVRPLIRSLVRPLVELGASFYTACASLVEKWLLNGSLNGSDGTPITLTRGSLKIYESNLGKWLPYDDLADLLTYGLANKCENYSLKPTNTTGITDGTNVTTTIVDETASLTAASFDFGGLITRGVANGNAYSTVNADAGEQSVTITGQVGNTNAHSFGVLVYVSTAGTVKLTLGGTEVTSQAVTAETWTVLSFTNETPALSTDEVAIKLQAGQAVKWIAAHLEESDTFQSAYKVKEGTSTVDRIFTDTSGMLNALSLQSYTKEDAYGVGLSLEGASTNKNLNYNFSPDAALTSLTDTNATTTRVFRDAELRALGFGALIDAGVMNGYVLSTASSAVNGSAFPGGGPGNLNPHSLRVWARVTAGTSGKLVLGAAGAPAGSVAITGSEFQEYVVENVTPSGTGNPLRIVCDDASTTIEWFGNQLEESEIVTSPIVTEGATGTRNADDASVSTTGFPVNDCSYYIELPKGIRDNGANQVIFDSETDANNNFRLFFISGTQKIRLQKRVAGVNYRCEPSYTADGTPLKILVTLDSTAGSKCILSNGNSDTEVNTTDAVLSATMQLGALETNTLPLYAEEANFKIFNSVIDDINDARWC